MTDTTVNYTDDMVTAMTDRYNAVPTLDTARAIADDFGKSTKSVVAKLVSLGIYKKADRKTKTGAPVIQKADLVKAINASTGLQLDSLVKATKADLIALRNALA